MAITCVRLLVDFVIHDGKLAEFETVARRMVALTEPEPGTTAYHFVFSADRTRCRLVEGYINGDAVAAHFNGPAFLECVPELIQFGSPTRMEIYGEPGPMMTVIANAYGAEIFTSWQGFER